MPIRQVLRGKKIGDSRLLYITIPFEHIKATNILKHERIQGI